MKASIFYQHGGLDVLKYEDVKEPRIDADEVLIRVKACAMNHLDLWLRDGLPGIKIPLPHILGADISGIVEECGNVVSNVKTGDEVLLAPGLGCGHCEQCLSGNDNLCRYYTIIGYMVDGGYAEYVKVPSKNVIPKPDNLTFEEASAIPLVFLTAWHMLVKRVNLKPGEVVLIHAAGSGVGSAAIQIAKMLGAKVIATASTREKLKKAEELGADFTINYQTTNFYQEVRKITNKKGVNVVFEHTGTATWDKSVKSLATNGRLVTCGATSGYEANLNLRFLFAKHISIYGSYMGGISEVWEVIKFFKEGKLKPVIDRTLTLKEASKAHKIMESRKQFGKIILIP
ncbi:alcohol dehydrogenase [candidate division KSB1 bacterium]|nr:MAG: alcohol dehydrogenase [candidate division KSB1 bacterium]